MKRMLLVLASISALLAPQLSYGPAEARPPIVKPADPGDEIAFAGNSLVDQLILFNKRKKKVLNKNAMGSYPESAIARDLQKNVQVAFVFDGTLSMKKNLELVKNSFSKILKSIEDAVKETRNQGDDSPVTMSVALILYRDVKCGREDNKSAPIDNLEDEQRAVHAVTDRFETVVGGELNEMLAEKLNLIEGEVYEGYPGFEEQVDRGLHFALAQLPWASDSEEEKYTRLVYLIGDAPPWDESLLTEEGTKKFLEANVKQAKNDIERGKWKYMLEKYRIPYRGHSTDELIRLATKPNQQIVIHTLVCDSGYIGDEKKNANFQQRFDDHKDDLKDFFGKVSVATGGSSVDLTNEDDVNKIKKEVINPPEVRDISHLDISQQRLEEFGKAQASRALRVIVASPSGQKYWAQRDAAARLSVSLKWLSGLAIFEINVDDNSVESLADGLQEFASGNSSETMVVFFSEDSSKTALTAWWLESIPQKMETKPFLSDKLVANHKGKASEDRLESKNATSVVDGLLDEMKKLSALPDSLKVYLRERSRAHLSHVHPEIERRLAALAVGGPLMSSSDPESAKNSHEVSRDEFLEGIDKLLQDLESHASESEQCYLKFLRANYYAWKNRDDLVAICLKEARELSDQPDVNELLRLEIEADHAMIVRHDLAEAIRKYEELRALSAASGLGASQQSARYCWVLSGLYFGRWGAHQGTVDDKKASERVLELLVSWPNSPEAIAYRKLFGLPEAGSPDSSKEVAKTQRAQVESTAAAIHPSRRLYEDIKAISLATPQRGP
jgi:hypothetical protein